MHVKYRYKVKDRLNINKIIDYLKKKEQLSYIYNNAYRLRYL